MAFNTPAQSGHIDANQYPSLTVVQGTLGTADTGGTASTMPVSGNPVTGAQYVEILAGGGSGTSGTNVNIITGTINNIGSVVGLGGTSFVSITNGTFSDNILSGTMQTLGTVGVVNNLVTGTLASIGSVVGVGVVSNLTNGSVNILTGTMQQLNNVGTLQAGTVQLNPIPSIGISTFGTYGTTGATIFGTLVGGTSSGAGTEIFVTSVSIQIPSTAGSQNVSAGFGTNGGTFHQGTGAIVMGNFVAGGGITKFFSPPLNSGTNAQLTYFQSGAGTVSVNITYFVTASTL